MEPAMDVRHHIMARFGALLSMVWVNPAHHWRESFKSAAAAPQQSDADHTRICRIYAGALAAGFLRPGLAVEIHVRQRLLSAAGYSGIADAARSFYISGVRNLNPYFK